VVGADLRAARENRAANQEPAGSEIQPYLPVDTQCFHHQFLGSGATRRYQSSICFCRGIDSVPPTGGDIVYFSRSPRSKPTVCLRISSIRRAGRLKQAAIPDIGKLS